MKSLLMPYLDLQSLVRFLKSLSFMLVVSHLLIGFLES